MFPTSQMAMDKRKVIRLRTDLDCKAGLYNKLVSHRKSLSPATLGFMGREYIAGTLISAILITVTTANEIRLKVD